MIAASITIKTIEETLSEIDPYNHFFPDPDDSRSIRDCNFPDEVEDPLELVRVLRGDAFVQRVEYEDDLEHTLHVLSDCFNEELARQGLREYDLLNGYDSDDDSGRNLLSDPTTPPPAVCDNDCLSITC